MRIAVNTRLLLPGRLEGIGWYTYEAFSRITRNHPEHQFFFLFDRPFSREFVFAPNVTPVVIGLPARHPVLWYAWFEYSVSRFLRQNAIDIFVSPDGYLSLRSEIPQVAVIHDINFLHHPEWLPLLHAKYMNRYFPLYARKARRIATVSQFSKHDIVSEYGIAPERIDVTYNGANPAYTPLPEREQEQVRKNLSDGKPYFLFVGAFNPRKNLSVLIDAFDLFKHRTRSDIKLMLVGEPMFRKTGFEAAYRRCRYQKDIIFAGRKDLRELTAITASAFATVYPSLFEGFGIPVLESMQCDIPLAVSGTTSLPEVAGDAAIYFNPTNPEDIARTMAELRDKPELRARLIGKGREQRNRYSWNATAETLYQCIIKATE